MLEIKASGTVGRARTVEGSDLSIEEFDVEERKEGGEGGEGE